MVSSPAPPDPWQTAQAQSQWNTTTAATQQAMNMTDQTTPWGSSTYTQNGTQTIIGADGKPIQVPKYNQTTTLSPEQQAIFEQTQVAQGNLADLAAEQSDFMGDYLSKPFEFDNQAAADWAYDIGASRLNPELAQREQSLRTTLASKGIREGSAAWNAEMSRLTQAENDARNNLALSGREMAFGESLAKRNQPINELSALMSGSQVGMPQFGATPQTGVGGVDYTGLVNNQYQAQSQQAGAANGGLFGLLGTGLSLFSDKRLKSGIKVVGQLDNGLPVYSYRYKWGGPVQIGLMAQDVEKSNPSAVHTHASGYKMVDYSAAVEH